ncbi:peptidase inhibitor family I36 protein [Sphaerisporangium sp. NPDC005288]|uniref:peptidase inhibitor family I36 protein n=1 Tax=Sphaerisporangium sp. NPDC005288 TaxID=3155114 RepID=UPI0033B3DD6E
MHRRNTALAALGLAALALFATPGAAQADNPSSSDSAVTTPTSKAAPIASAPSAVSAASTPDGYFLAWYETNRGGPYCRWLNDDGNWDTCSGMFSEMGMRNQASSLENRGWPGSYDDVNLYYSPNYLGSRNCLPNGYYLNNLAGIYYLWDGKSGQGQSMNNNIASHRWTNSC